MATIVAFPLPDVTAPSGTNNFVIPAPDEPANFMQFETLVDGIPVAMSMEQKALAIGIDRTGE